METLAHGVLVKRASVICLFAILVSLNAVADLVLTWDASPDAWAYRVYRATNSSGPYHFILQTTNTTASVHSDPGQSWWYVSSIGNGLEGAPSEFLYVNAQEVPLLAPAPGASTITTPMLSWAAVTNPVPTGYVVEVFGDSAFSSMPVRWAMLNPTNTSYFVPYGVLLPNTTYYWRVEAVLSNADGYTATNDLSRSFVTSGTFPSAPAQPSNFSPMNGATNQPLQPTLTLSPFVGDQVQSARFQVFLATMFWPTLVWDSGMVSARQSMQVPANFLSYSGPYLWWGAYQSTNGLWSPFSIQTAFTTADPPAPPAYSFNLGGGVSGPLILEGALIPAVRPP